MFGKEKNKAKTNKQKPKHLSKLENIQPSAEKKTSNLNYGYG